MSETNSNRLEISAENDAEIGKEKIKKFLEKRKRSVRPYSGFRIKDRTEFKFFPDEK